MYVSIKGLLGANPKPQTIVDIDFDIDIDMDMDMNKCDYLMNIHY